MDRGAYGHKRVGDDLATKQQQSLQGLRPGDLVKGPCQLIAVKPPRYWILALYFPAQRRYIYIYIYTYIRNPKVSLISHLELSWTAM